MIRRLLRRLRSQPTLLIDWGVPVVAFIVFLLLLMEVVRYGIH